MKKQMNTQKMKMKKLISNNGISNTDLEEHIQLESIHKDIVGIIDKYAKDRKNISSYGEISKSDKGFFLMWVKKDLSLQENDQIQITTFAQFIDMNEIIGAMEKIIKDMALEQKMPVNIA